MRRRITVKPDRGLPVALTVVAFAGTLCLIGSFMAIAWRAANPPAVHVTVPDQLIGDISTINGNVAAMVKQCQEKPDADDNAVRDHGPQRHRLDGAGRRHRGGQRYGAYR